MNNKGIIAHQNNTCHRV